MDCRLRVRELQELYVKASFPIERGGMALRHIDLIHATAFISSLSATIFDLAKIFPDWARFDDSGQILENWSYWSISSNAVFHRSY